MVRCMYIAIIKGTDVCTVSSVLLRLSRRRRYQVREITSGYGSPNMEQIARSCFPAAKRVTDRFHVRNWAYEAVQEMREKARWEALDEESTQIAMQKPVAGYITLPFSPNGIRGSSCWQEASIFFTRKNPCDPVSKRTGLDILFKEYPEIKKGYYLAYAFRPDLSSV
ncbi:MAG: transposase [Bacteroides cellulosilyticus]